jgi:hypothetical protein
LPAKNWWPYVCSAYTHRDAGIGNKFLGGKPGGGFDPTTKGGTKTLMKIKTGRQVEIIVLKNTIEEEEGRRSCCMRKGLWFGPYMYVYR